MGRSLNIIILFIYFVLGLYLMNSFFSFVVIPEFFSNYNDFIYLLSGILMVLGGIFYLQSRRGKFQ